MILSFNSIFYNSNNWLIVCVLKFYIFGFRFFPELSACFNKQAVFLRII
jgi:hypothetical protein